MNKTEIKRRIITEKLAEHLLGHGMKGASLRPLAAAAGMSDRMLLHYFTDKEELLTATLFLVAERLMQKLDSVRSEQMPFENLLHNLSNLLQDPYIRPFLRLWLELAASVAGGEESYRPIARKICDDFFEWIASALKVEREADRRPLAALAFATIEGFVILDALDSGSLITNALDGIAIR